MLISLIIINKKIIIIVINYLNYMYVFGKKYIILSMGSLFKELITQAKAFNVILPIVFS